MTTNGETGHALCAFMLWEEAARRKQLEMENAALKQELAALKSEKPDASVS